ncbi:hypothetical protein [Pseudomonas aeruginosa]|uniref:hypothetical protein n=1 Tax=Pseudomonas aeruginosa TaxID=287 RepID=UPI003AADBDC6
MPLFVALFSFLSSVAGPLVAKGVLISLGVGAATYAGINLLISQVKEMPYLSSVRSVLMWLRFWAWPSSMLR